MRHCRAYPGAGNVFSGQAHEDGDHDPIVRQGALDHGGGHDFCRRAHCHPRMNEPFLALRWTPRVRWAGNFRDSTTTSTGDCRDGLCLVNGTCRAPVMGCLPGAGGHRRTHTSAAAGPTQATSAGGKTEMALAKGSKGGRTPKTLVKLR